MFSTLVRNSLLAASFVLGLLVSSALPQEIESVGVVQLEETDQIEIKTAITNLGDFKVVDGFILLEKDAKPKTAQIADLTLAGNFSSALVTADDENRNVVPTKKASEKQWLISGSGKVVVLVTKIYESPIRLEQSRFVVDFAQLPNPPPKPDPDEPVVPVPSDPSPFSEEGHRALIVYELDEVAKYSSAIQKTLYGKAIRDWAIANSARDGKGQPEFRVFDQNTVNQPDKWMKLLNEKRTSLPWIYIGNGKTGYSGPLPATEEATIQLLNKYR